MDKDKLKAGYAKAEDLTDRGMMAIKDGRFTTVIIVAVMILAAIGLYAIFL